MRGAHLAWRQPWEQTACNQQWDREEKLMLGFPRAAAAAVALLALSAPARADRWIASWTGAAQGPYPVGNPTAQPELGFTFPSPERGARDQSFRLIIRPDAWGSQTRIR